MKSGELRIKEKSDNYKCSTICINRVVKVIEGGRRFRFTALVVIGYENGVVGYGKGKGSDVSSALTRAEKSAKKNTFKIPIINGTIPHEVYGYYNGTKVLFLPSISGTGIKVGGAARVICELAGVQDVMSKYFKRNSKYNAIMAAINALKKLRDPVKIAKDRNVSIEKVFKG